MADLVLSRDALTRTARSFVPAPAAAITPRELFLAMLALQPQAVLTAWQGRGFPARVLRAALAEWWLDESSPFPLPSLPLAPASASLLAGLPDDASLLPPLLDRLLPSELSFPGAALAHLGLL